MCRIINFVSGAGGVGKSSIIYELSNRLAADGKRVCVFDAYFSINSIFFSYKTKTNVDLKEIFSTNFLIDGTLNYVNNNLRVIKTNSSITDYLSHEDEIKKYFKELEKIFDYILIDTNSFDSRILKLVSKISNEAMLITNNTFESLRRLETMLPIILSNENLKNIKVIFNKARLIHEFDGRAFSFEDIEDILKVKVLFTIPLFYKHNYFKNEKYTFYQKNLIDNFYYVFITNKPFNISYKNKYLGIVGLIKRRLYEKYE